MRVAWNKGKFSLHKCKGCEEDIRKWQVFCSKDCYFKSKTRSILLDKTCLYCQVIFQIKPANKKQKFCSIRCGLKHRRSPLLGFHHSEESKRKNSESHRGLLRGDLNPNWKGGKGTERHLLMGQYEYIEWRRLVFERDNYTCQNCHIRGIRLNADHIQPWALFPALRYDIKNGRTLCEPCHRKTETWGNRPIYRKEMIQL